MTVKKAYELAITRSYTNMKDRHESSRNMFAGAGEF